MVSLVSGADHAKTELHLRLQSARQAAETSVGNADLVAKRVKRDE
jgi:hypothetical protein